MADLLLLYFEGLGWRSEPDASNEGTTFFELMLDFACSIRAWMPLPRAKRGVDWPRWTDEPKYRYLKATSLREQQRIFTDAARSWCDCTGQKLWPRGEQLGRIGLARCLGAMKGTQGRARLRHAGEVCDWLVLIQASAERSLGDRALHPLDKPLFLSMPKTLATVTVPENLDSTANLKQAAAAAPEQEPQASRFDCGHAAVAARQAGKATHAREMHRSGHPAPVHVIVADGVSGWRCEVCLWKFALANYSKIALRVCTPGKPQRGNAAAVQSARGCQSG
jgi:hypothetical protein